MSITKKILDKIFGTSNPVDIAGKLIRNVIVGFTIGIGLAGALKMIFSDVTEEIRRYYAIKNQELIKEEKTHT